MVGTFILGGVMGIDQVDKIPSMNEDSLPILQKILDDNAEKTEGTLFTNTLPTANTVPVGKKVIYDDGAGTKRIYWKTGKGNLGYITLT